VLNRQSDEIQAFLYSTSLLERLTAPLCDALTGNENGKHILEYLEQNNLFMIPLDDERRWYRYHRLFADLLKDRLAHTDAGRIPGLHLRASAWYESHGLFAEAVDHALSAQDFDRAAKLVAGNAISLIDHGEKQSLGDWLETLPDEMIHSQPWLSVANAWRYVYTGRLEAVDPLLQDAEIRLAEVSTQIERQQLSGHIAAIRVYKAELRGEFDEAIVLARESLELLPEHDLSARCFSATRLGSALRLRGNLGEAEEALEDALSISQTIGDSHVSVNVLCELAGLYMWQGYFRKAENVCEQALLLAEEHFRRSGRRLPIVGHAFSRLSYIYYEWNDLDGAIDCAQEGIQHSERGSLKEILADNTIYLAMALQAKGDEAGASEAIMNARRIGVALSPWYIEVLEPYEAHIRLVQGDFESARRLVDERDFIRQGEFGIEYFLNKNMLSRILIIQDQPPSERLNEAESVLAELIENAERIGSQLFVIKTLALQALLFQARGDPVKATNYLERALSLGEAEGFVRSFIDLGPPMGELLSTLFEQGIAAHYAQKLLGEMAHAMPAAEWQIAAARTTREIPSMFEALTEREVQVLRLLNTELSIPEIADELIVGVSTVRSHVKNIYSKLGVHSRYEAIAKAKELDIF
jgi:LuxR family maltose regulon positive regulatory protein